MAETNAGGPPTPMRRSPSDGERVELYQRLRRVARKFERAPAAKKSELAAAAAQELVGPAVADRVCAGVPEVDGLGELDAYAVAYLSGLLEGTVGDWIVADQDTRIDGCAPEMVSIRGLVPRYSASWRSVLIVGERGSGKGQLMRATAAARGKQPPLTINLAAVSEGVADSELFGHVRGAFTGAERTRKGIVRTASESEGALYLDDVAECPEHIQVRLLTCLDDGVIRPVGSDEIVSVGRGRNRKFRVFSSSQPGALHKLRPDLRDRLAGLLIVLPPLRQMSLDILLLADVALRSQAAISSEDGRRVRFSRGARRVMMSYSWPGNIRQLFNLVGRALAKAAGAPRIGSDVVRACLRDEQWLQKLSARDGADDELGGGEPGRRGRAPFPTLAEAEARLVQEALAWTGGNVTQAARLLGVDRMTLHRRRKRMSQGEGSAASS